MFLAPLTSVLSMYPSFNAIQVKLFLTGTYVCHYHVPILLSDRLLAKLLSLAITIDTECIAMGWPLIQNKLEDYFFHNSQ